jgi:hypothetical protein
MSNKHFAGIGSRETPIYTIKAIKELICPYLVENNFILRSGGADGADKAFEDGYDSVKGIKEIYLPWKNFNNNDSPLYGVCNNALKLAEQTHPLWDRLGIPAKKLQARNTYQVLGWGLNSPSAFVICWTPDGSVGRTSKQTGGTGQAIRLAYQSKIEIFNLKNYEDGLYNYYDLLKEIKEKYVE